MLQTTLAGSLPKPSWLAEPERLWAPWKLDGAALDRGEARRDHPRREAQEDAGIDIVGDGEQARVHFVHGFIANLDGIDFGKRTVMGIRGPLQRGGADGGRAGPAQGPGACAEARRRGRRRRRKLKFTLPGPMTIVDTIADEHYGSRRELALAFADGAERGGARARGDRRRRDPVRRAGLQRLHARGADWGIAALEARGAQGLRCTTAVHICYGYGIKANIDWKETLGSEWRQYEETFPLLAKSRIDQVSLECRNSHVPIELIRLLEGKDVLVGAIDVATDASRRRRRSRRRSAPRCRYVAPEKLYPVHELRHGADDARRRLRQARGTGGRRASRAQELGRS